MIGGGGLWLSSTPTTSIFALVYTASFPGPARPGPARRAGGDTSPSARAVGHRRDLTVVQVSALVEDHLLHPFGLCELCNLPPHQPRHRQLLRVVARRGPVLLHVQGRVRRQRVALALVRRVIHNLGVHVVVGLVHAQPRPLRGPEDAPPALALVPPRQPLAAR